MGVLLEDCRLNEADLQIATNLCKLHDSHKSINSLIIFGGVRLMLVILSLEDWQKIVLNVKPAGDS